MSQLRVSLIEKLNAALQAIQQDVQAAYAQQQQSGDANAGSDADSNAGNSDQEVTDVDFEEVKQASLTNKAQQKTSHYAGFFIAVVLFDFLGFYTLFNKNQRNHFLFNFVVKIWGFSNE